MATPAFEYCSLQYLNQWISHDSKYCDGLASGKEDTKLTALKNACGFYGISRNLPLAADKGRRYGPLMDVLDSVNAEDFETNLLQGIRKVESDISKKYLNRGVLSLTTKVLWLKVKSPVIIYDSQARNAIGTKVGDLEGFYAKWRIRFKKQEKRITAACAQLVTMSKYTFDEELAASSYIQEVTAHCWFRERVFDNYLRNLGANA